MPEVAVAVVVQHSLGQIDRHPVTDPHEGDVACANPPVRSVGLDAQQHPVPRVASVDLDGHHGKRDPLSPWILRVDPLSDLRPRPWIAPDRQPSPWAATSMPTASATVEPASASRAAPRLRAPATARPRRRARSARSRGTPGVGEGEAAEALPIRSRRRVAGGRPSHAAVRSATITMPTTIGARGNTAHIIPGIASAVGPV